MKNRKKSAADYVKRKIYPEHLEDLRQSGLNDETIQRAGIYSCNSNESPFTSRMNDQVNTLLVFPYDRFNEYAKNFYRAKLFPPVILPNGKKKRYHSEAKRGNRLYITETAYNLRDRTDYDLCITEGEKKAEAGSQNGLVCIGISGLWNWTDSNQNNKALLPDFHLFKLNNRNLNIVPDNDYKDRKHKGQLVRAVDELALRLSLLGVNVYIVQLPHTDEKIGLDDYLLNHSSDDFEKLPRLPYNLEKLQAKKPNQAEAILSSCKDIHLFHDQHEKAFAFIHNEAFSVRSKKFKLWLVRETNIQYGINPNSDSLNSAFNAIESKAIFDKEQIELRLRIAEKDDNLYYDLGNDAVEITPDGWKIINDLPILFRRYFHMKKQVKPERNGDIWLFFDFLNVAEKHKLLIAVYIISCFIPKIPKPAFIPNGAHGSGKTTLAKLIKDLCDPSEVETLITPRRPEELVQQLAHHHMAIFDNLSSLPVWMSDILCQAITGGGTSKRELYTDDDDIVYKLLNAIGLNGISLNLKPDLLDRSILLPLERISQTERRNIKEIEAEFQKAKPQIIGGIFDVIQRALWLYPSLKGSVGKLPRMADFAEWGFIIAEAIKRGNGDKFLETYNENVKRQNSKVIESSTLAQSVIAFMNHHEKWEGTIEECFEELCHFAGYDKEIPKDDRSFPKFNNKLRGSLDTIKANLIDEGINFKIGDHSRNGTPIELWKE